MNRYLEIPSPFKKNVICQRITPYRKKYTEGHETLITCLHVCCHCLLNGFGCLTFCFIKRPCNYGQKIFRDTLLSYKCLWHERHLLKSCAKLNKVSIKNVTCNIVADRIVVRQLFMKDNAESNAKMTFTLASRFLYVVSGPWKNVFSLIPELISFWLLFIFLMKFREKNESDNDVTLQIYSFFTPT